jgi:hypothetical protein
LGETIEKAKNKQWILAKKQDVLGLGYATREDLRELDKKLRDCYNADFELSKVRNVKSLILDLESKWDGREKEFRPLEV